jgi:hypothetical protein
VKDTHANSNLQQRKQIQTKFMETLDSVIARLRPSFSILAEQITAFASQLETGSNRLELREGAARVVASEL